MIQPHMSVSEALTYIGNLSEPSKMPWYSYNLPATACKAGAKLAQVKGSVCHGCYAYKGNYAWPIVKNAMARRLASLTDLKKWKMAMIIVLKDKARDRKIVGEPYKYFRWHDSGDIQSLQHLSAINFIALSCPEIKFWLPTHEYGMVRRFIWLYGSFASNLTVRISDAMVDGISTRIGIDGKILPTSGVKTHLSADAPLACPARFQGHKCLDCRRCWDQNTAHVDYPKH